MEEIKKLLQDLIAKKTNNTASISGDPTVLFGTVVDKIWVSTKKEDATNVVFCIDYSITFKPNVNEWYKYKLLVSPCQYEIYSLDGNIFFIDEHDTYLSWQDFEKFKQSGGIKDLRIFENRAMAVAFQKNR